jgi:hypothetical protein
MPVIDKWHCIKLTICTAKETTEWEDSLHNGRKTIIIYSSNRGLKLRRHAELKNTTAKQQ